MQIRDDKLQRQPSIKTYLQKSNSAAIIYGDRNNSDYADSLMSFHKDFATIDNERRIRQYQKKHQSLQKRKQENLMREIQAKQNEKLERQKLLERQKKSQRLYNQGSLKNTLVTSLPVNPLSSEYKKNQSGQKLAAKDEEKGLDRLVRAHYLHTIGNSGYNIISGRSSIDFEKIVPKQKSEAFEKKIFKLYQMFKLNPQGH